MRRYWVVALAVLTLLGVLSPPALAQAPTPKVTISGVLQQVNTWSRNALDLNATRSGDREWYSNTRGRPDIIAEVGNVKMVLGIEIDATFGQVGTTDSNTAIGAGPGGAQHTSMTSGFDLGTDVQGNFEVKWLYTEFPFTGVGSLLPFIPVPTVARVGAQPYAVVYKTGILANTDYAGINLVTTWTPAIKSHLSIGQLEEQTTGIQNTNSVAAGGRCANQALQPQGAATVAAGAACRGDDLAFYLGVEVTPLKGLDVRPVFSFLNVHGTTGTGGANTRTAIGALPATISLSDEERRYTIGFDSRWTVGNFYLDPTYFYQFGEREVRAVQNLPFVGAGNPNLVGVRHNNVTADISAHFVDVRGGYRTGPLLLEAMVGFSSGNKGRDNLAKEIRYYHPQGTDGTYYAAWANILALGVDSVGVAGLAGMGQISYFQYGRVQTGVRATYSWTPMLDTYIAVSPTWTARSVDTDTPAATRAKGCVGNGVAGIDCSFKGDSSYIGTETNLGLVWRFAPNTRFEMVGAWLAAGSALDGAEVVGIDNGMTGRKLDASDAYLISSKISFNF